MRITWNELTVPNDAYDADDLLAEWRWLVGDMQLGMVSTLGDAFLADAAGAVFWLDTGTGTLTRIANNVDEFQSLRQQPQHASQWFVPNLIGDLMEKKGLRLQPGEVFSYKVPPVLGGEMVLDNFATANASVHFSMLGQIHRQVKDLPPGTKISGIEMQ